ALEKAKQLYKGWIKVQLFCALYALGSIYFLGVYGLISILVINMILMASTSFYVSEKSGINSKNMIYEFLTNKKFVSFLTIILISTILIRILFDIFSILNIYSILLKSIALATIIFIFISRMYKTELMELIISFRKK